MISIAKPIIENEEINAVKKVMESGMIACGKVVEEFENEFANFMQTKYGTATTSGTTALHAAMIACGIDKGDKVITTPFTFIATSNSILFEEAVPVFADINPVTFNIDSDSVEKLINENKDVKAILVVHLFGLSSDMDRIMDIANKYNLIVIEDCAQAHGAKYKGKVVGSYGKASAYSFYPTKNMTTGEGGIVLTNEDDINEKLKLTINHGQAKRYVHTVLGYNFRMTNIAAAIGIEQLKKLNDFNNKRRENAKFYNENIHNPRIILPTEPEGYYHVYHQYTVKVEDREKFKKHLENNGIGYGVYYPIPSNEQPYYKGIGYNPEETPVSYDMSKKVVSLPIHPALTYDELNQVVKVVNSYE